MVSYLCTRYSASGRTLPTLFFLTYVVDLVTWSFAPDFLLTCIFFTATFPFFLSIFIQSAWIMGLFTSMLLIIQFFQFRTLLACSVEEVLMAVRNLQVFSVVLILLTAVSSFLIGTLRKNYARRILTLLQRANDSVEAKKTFVALISHEIRNPLHVLLGCLHLLDQSVTEHQKELLAAANSAGDFLYSLLSNVLDIARLEDSTVELHPTPCDMREICQKAIRIFRPQCEVKGLHLSSSVTEAVPRSVVSDSSRLMQILVNLLGNAVKFTPEGAVTLTVDWKGCLEEEEGVGSGRLLVSVEDTGIGMTEAVQGKLFQKFAQGDGSVGRRYGGTGLGLYLARALLQRMQSDLRYTTEPGKGTTFFFELLVAVDSTQKEGNGQVYALVSKGSSGMPCKGCKGASVDVHTSTSTPTPSTGGPREEVQGEVLLVDDSSTNCKILSRMLETIHRRTKCVYSGTAAVQSLIQERFDLVFLDLQMPDTDGYAVLEQYHHFVRCNNVPRVPVVIVTGNATDADRSLCERKGVFSFLTKPVRLPDLKQVLNDLLLHPLKHIRVFIDSTVLASALPSSLAVEYSLIVDSPSKLVDLYSTTMIDIVFVSQATHFHPTVAKLRTVERFHGWKRVPVFALGKGKGGPHRDCSKHCQDQEDGVVDGYVFADEMDTLVADTVRGTT
eukprot:GILJ01015372.1.p1 GENE.GILJ01015372.1~~GILJ01015372.1.p1  ORF type:complete len:712 (-),score=89.71 GILJ01015372.1:137-2146(-)